MCVRKCMLWKLPLNIALIKAAVSFPFRAAFVISAVNCRKSELKI